MVFVGRKGGAIYGLWTVCQWAGQETLRDDDPEVVAFRERKPPERSTEQKVEAMAKAFGFSTVDELKKALQ